MRRDEHVIILSIAVQSLIAAESFVSIHRERHRNFEALKRFKKNLVSMHG